ncbi:MAG: WecB/TagA/CpsF family glycosyltransferase [Patescibacteria group bacterium]|nr:WecB/TagA/CpsF family glycosyltransferase [Patescibacteria group bacterium]
MLPLKIVEILDVKVHAVRLPEALQAITDMVRSRKNHYIVTPNPEMVMYAQKHEWFKSVLNNASLSLVDGVGLIWAAKYLVLPMTRVPILRQIQEFLQWLITGAAVVFAPRQLNVIPEHLRGSDMVWEIAKLASERNYRIFLLGAGPGVALKAARVMQTLYPRLNVVEVMVGPPYEDEVDVIQRIQQTNPQIIFLAYPADKQMKWMKDTLPQLKNVIAIGIGGALDFIVQGTAMNAKVDRSPAIRAPKWVRDIELEWLWRFLTQPWRKDRVKTATIDFMLKVRHYKLEK